MVKLNKAKYRVRDNNWPQHSAVKAVYHETDTSYKINDSNFLNVFQQKAQNNKKRCGVTDITCNFRSHV